MSSRPFFGLLLICTAAAACDEGPSAPRDPSPPTPSASLVYAGWSDAVRVEDIPGTASMFNTPDADGCPFVSPDGKRLFMASTRPGGLGGIDIWISRRSSEDDPWGEPVNAGAPINSEFNDFCPTLSRDGHTFLFVSNRPGGCGGTDIYTSRYRDDGGFDDPQNLGCAVNSVADEQNPFPLPNDGGGPVLYFSSFRAGGFADDGAGAAAGDGDIYRSDWRGSHYAPAHLVAGVNSAADDAQPNLSRDGLEMFFYSTRVGTLGGPDIYTSTRTHDAGSWSDPVNLGPTVNSSAGDSRPSLSWDGTTLYFGSSRPGGEGGSDIYVTRRGVLR